MNTTYKILIVDDEIEHIEAIIEILEETEAPYRILQSFNARSAFQIAVKEIPDLIITDWEMPEMSGIELIKKLKATNETAPIPVLMNTGVMTSSENLNTALKAGAIDYIRKPVDRIELVARIQSILKIADYQKEIAKYQKEAIEQKDRELAENSMYLVQNNEFLIKSIKELQLVKNQMVDSEKLKTINQIIGSFESKVKEGSWNRFEICFERIHSDFRRNLLSEFPNLTSTELRLCAFLRLGMSTKDIAAALFQSPDGVKVKRSRLRKKLKLSESDNLNVFLSNF